MFSNGCISQIYWTGFNFIMWYTISAFYNIYNKKALNILQLPVLVATIQMGTGLCVFLPLWLSRVRTSPFHSVAEAKQVFWTLKNVAVYTTLSHVAGVIALGSGTVSFSQVIF